MGMGEELYGGYTWDDVHDDEDFINVGNEVITETEKAYLLSINGQKFWIAKSRTVMDGDSILVESWVLRKNGINYGEWEQ